VDASRDELRPEDTGARLRAVRELAGLDQRIAAREAGLSRRELDAAERGRRRLTNAELEKLAAALRVAPDVLAVRENDRAFGRPVGLGAEQPPGPAHETVTAPEDDLFAALDALGTTANLPHGERRRDFRTRERIEASFQTVRNEMEEVLIACSALISANSGDDVQDLLLRLGAEIDRLRHKRSFLRNASRHQRELARVRGRIPTAVATDDGASYEGAPIS